MRKLIPLISAIILTVLFSFAAFAIISEQDRALIGDRNLLRNPGFEAGRQQWTPTVGATWTVTTTAANVGLGSVGGAWDPTANAQTLTASSMVIPSGLYLRSGSASCLFKTAATDVVFEVTDGTNVLSSFTVASGSTFTEQSSNFVFPSSGNIVLRLRAQSDSAVTYIDGCYIGEARNTAQVTQATMYGGARWIGTTNCTWDVVSAGAFSSFTADADCTTPAGANLYGAASAPSTNVPGVTFSTLPPGDYLITATGTFIKGSTSATPCDFRLTDGTNNSGAQAVFTNGITGGAPVISGRFSYTAAQSNITFQVQAGSDSGANSCQVDISLSTMRDLVILAHRFPTNNETLFTADQVGWFADAYITGANFDLGTAAVGAYVAPSNGGVTMTQLPGSIETLIPCTSTNDSTGATCSAGSEQTGIAFTVPKQSDIMVCADYVHELSMSAASRAITNFKIVLTPNAAQTISSEGITVSQTEATSSIITANPHSYCELFKQVGPGKKTFRIMYTQTILAGTVSSSLLTGGVVSTDPVVRIRAWPLTSTTPAPLLVNSTVSNRAAVTRQLEAVLNCDAGSVITSQSGTTTAGIATIGNISTGVCAGTFAGMWSSAPSCTASIKGATLDTISRIDATSSTAFNLYCLTPSTGAAVASCDVQVFCSGPR